MKEYIDTLSPSVCKEFPDKIFVFGDNMIHKGKAGQACIRGEPNAYGIPTKRLPSMQPQAFFSDREDEFECVLEALRGLYVLSRKHTIVFPTAGVGTGLARMDERSPVLFLRINEIINTYF